MKDKSLGQLVMQTREELARLYPACFQAKGAEKKPLAVGVAKAAIDRTPFIAAGLVKMAINNYVRGPKYQRNCIEGAPRIDLDGNVVGAVTAQDASYHRNVLAVLEQKFAKHARKIA